MDAGNAPVLELLSDRLSQMTLGDRAALEGVLSLLDPALAVEIGTATGGSLARISAHSDAVHAFDLARSPALTADRFPNVTFHTGDSHELLPQFLGELAAEGGNVDFALVDGDHSARGARRDLEDLLGSPSVSRTLILVHDTLNGRVRAGFEAVDYAAFEKVRLVDLDFVTGVLYEGPLENENELWAGFGLIVVGWELPRDGPPWPRVHDTADIFDAYLRTRGGPTIGDRPRYPEIETLERQIAVLSSSLAQMKRSLSWRLTAPLRRGKHITRRLRGHRT